MPDPKRLTEHDLGSEADVPAGPPSVGKTALIRELALQALERLEGPREPMKLSRERRGEGDEN